MSGYIKREDENSAKVGEVVARVIYTLQTMLPADVAPVRHGRWINDAGAQKCSVCGMSFSDLHPLYERAEYCPNCGAKMYDDK